MFATQVAAAIDAARTLTRLDHLSKDIWAAFGAGSVTDDEAGRLAELLHDRRRAMRGEIVPVGIPAGRPSLFPPRRLQRPPDRSVAMTRRRQLAASGPMPPALAARFTVAELAVLRIVSDEVRERGRCDRTIAELAARAGCGRWSVQQAVRQAAKLGLLTVEERRRQGQKNLPNMVRVVSREWLGWIARRPRRVAEPAIGFEFSSPTDRQIKKAADAKSWFRPREPLTRSWRSGGLRGGQEVGG